MNGRYEITEIKIHGDEYGPRRIRITSPDGSWDEIDQSDDGKVRLEDVIIGAIRQLQSDLAAVSAERDLLAREISEADDLARHFVRDRPTLRARGAIVLQADEIGKLRAQIAEYENAPVVATVIAHIDQGGIDVCADGHTWVFIGGAACCNQDHEDAVNESKPVHECSRCNDYDYGDHFCRNECPNRNLKAAP